MTVSDASNIFSHLLSSQKTLKSIFLFVLCFTLAAVSFSGPKVGALTIDSARDCDNNAVLYCGALTPNEVKEKYYASASARTIFHNMGVTHIDVEDIHNIGVEGKVTKGGRVLVNGKEVAVNAITAGRQNMPGSTAVTANNVTFYKRPPSVSFQSSSLPAFVVMRDGKFDFAIIASCGNPVMATAVVKKPAPKSAPAPAPTPQSPTPAPTQTQTQSQTVVVHTTKPAETTQEEQKSSSSEPEELPNTGVGDILGAGSSVALIGTAGHLIYRRLRF